MCLTHAPCCYNNAKHTNGLTQKAEAKHFCGAIFAQAERENVWLPSRPSFFILRKKWRHRRRSNVTFPHVILPLEIIEHTQKRSAVVAATQHELGHARLDEGGDA